MKLSHNKWKKTFSSPKFWARIMALFLTLLMLFGALSVLIPFLGMSSDAADYPTTANGDDLMIAVGLMYAGNVTVGFDVRAEGGFTLGSIVTEGADKHKFTALWDLRETYVTAACDSNLSRSGDDYAMTTSTDAVVGGYHVQVKSSSREDAKNTMVAWNQILEAQGTYAFMCHIGGSYAVRAGSCTDAASAARIKTLLESNGYTGLEQVSPSLTAVTVLDMTLDRILFEYDGGTSSTLGMIARQNGSSERFLVTPAQNTYRGIFKFTRYRSDSADGVALTNVLPLEDYIQGVLPWEIYTTWPDEAIKTFAVAARTFAVKSMTAPKHSTFDVCCSTCCQVYKGMNKTTSNVVRAVEATRGQIMTYTKNGQTSIATASYSSSMGGTTNSAAGAWRSSGTDYLIPVCTPWEEYENVSNGSWTQEYSPAELKRRLQIYFPNITADIASVQITKYVENSTYVYAVKFTDAKGNTATVEGGDRIRSYLGLKSSNFVVGKAGTSVQMYQYLLADRKAHTFFTGEEYPIAGGQGVYALDKEGNTVFVSTDGGVYGIGGDGQTVSMNGDLYALGGDSKTAKIDTASLYNSYQPYSSTNLPDVATLATQTVRVEETVQLSGTSGNFVFLGRGWGHGVGLSAYGTAHLAKYGYSYDAILKTYFQGIDLVNLKSYFGF